MEDKALFDLCLAGYRLPVASAFASSPASVGNATCYRCGSTGHYASFCTQHTASSTSASHRRHPPPHPTSWGDESTCTKRELLSLMGHLSFAVKVVKPGRLFLQCLIDVSSSVTQLHHRIHLSADTKAEKHGGGPSFPPGTVLTT